MYNSIRQQSMKNLCLMKKLKIFELPRNGPLIKIAYIGIKHAFSHHVVNKFQRLKCPIEAEASRNYILKTVWRFIMPVRRYGLSKFKNPLRKGSHAQLKIENPPSSFLFSSSVGDFD